MQTPVGATSKADADGLEEIHLDQLASEHVDIKRWINTSLQGLLTAEDKHMGNDAEVEACVMKVFNRLQRHLQEVSGSVEDTIAQALVRLPRTGLEIGRMATEAHQLQSQLQSMQDVAQSAVEAAAKPYVSQLNAFKKTQEKLTRCADTLRRASQVDSNMKRLDDIMQQLRVAPSEVDMDVVAEAISGVRSNLGELQKLEVTFGEKQLETVERYEQEVQRVVEGECIEMLRRREVHRAARLLKVLDTIGRADAVLLQYAVESMANEKERVEHMLGGSSGGATSMTPARAAELLKSHIMPSFGQALSEQLSYLLRMIKNEESTSADGGQVGKSSMKRHEVEEARTEKALRFMVDEVAGAISGALEPILERAERNEDLVTCCDAVRQLKLGNDVESQRSMGSINNNNNNNNNNNSNSSGSSSSLQEKLSKEITTYAFSKMIGLFGKPNILEVFERREVYRVEALVKDPETIFKRERFQLVMDAIVNAIKNIVRFFPDKTFPICIGKWRESILEAMSHLQPSPETPQGTLLENLSLARTALRQILLAAMKTTTDYLTSSEMQRLYPSVAAECNQLRTQLWEPLADALEKRTAECQQALKRTIVEPVVAKANGYDSQPLWESKQGEAADVSSGMTPSLVPYTPAQTAPSELVRALGEAIVEIPLALEALRGDGDNNAHRDGIEDLLEEVAAFWLDDIVRIAVEDFIENKVSNITIFFPNTAPDAARKEAAALDQLATDLNHLKSILSAVSGDPFEALERTLAVLKAVPLPFGKPIVIRQLLAQNV